MLAVRPLRVVLLPVAALTTAYALVAELGKAGLKPVGPYWTVKGPEPVSTVQLTWDEVAVRAVAAKLRGVGQAAGGGGVNV